MPPQATAPVAPQVNSALIAALRARALQASQGAGVPTAAPNSMNQPVAPQPTMGGQNATARPRTNPASAVMKAAQTAQSPLVADEGTRGLAKQLIMKLMQHM